MEPTPQPIIDDELIRDRVRAVLGEMKAAANPRATRAARIADLLRHPLASIALGFLLTGVLGGLLQYKLDLDRTAAADRESRRAQALLAVDTVGLRLNAVYFAAGRYYDGVRDRLEGRVIHDDTLAGRLGDLERMTAAFESREYIDAARVCIHFGPDALVEFRTVADSVHWIRPYMRHMRAKEMHPDTAGAHIMHLRNLVGRFAVTLVDKTANPHPPGSRVECT